MQKNVYHLVHNQPQLLRKVQPVSGDITQPGLGLDISRRQTLQQHVDVILHCAADIRLELDIKSALRANYLGTKAMLQFAAGCLHLRALVHTSSCYVNMNQPRSSVVYEQLYPLKFGTTVVDCEELVQVSRRGRVGQPAARHYADSMACEWLITHSTSSS